MSRNDLAEWKFYWGIRHAPCEGVSEALPYALDRTAGFHTNGVPHKILWMGRSPKYGLVMNSSLWLPSDHDGHPPACPAEGWEPWKTQLSGTLGTLPAYPMKTPFSLGGISSKPRTSRGKIETFLIEKETVRAELRNFLSLTPGFVHDAVRIRTHYKIDLSFSAIAFQMGNEPQAGTDVQTASLRRCQFLNSIPAACPFTDPFFLREIIDAGAPMKTELARIWECSERVVTLMGRLAPEVVIRLTEMLGMETIGLANHPQSVMAFMEGLPTDCAEWMVGDGKNAERPLAMFRLLAEAWLRLGEDSVEARVHVRCDLRHLAASIRRHPVHGYDWLTASGNNPMAHASDVALDFARDILVPARARTGKTQDARKNESDFAFRLLAAEGLPRLYKASLMHLSGNVHGPRIGVSSPQGSEWPLPCGEEFAVGERTLRFLRTQRDLNAETSALTHCVKSYGEDCRRGRCSIMSVGDWDTEGMWRPTSTVEIRVDENGRPFSYQHRAERNAPPSHDDINALRGWLDLEAASTKTDAPLADWSHLSAYGHERGNFVEDHLGEGWRTSEAHDYRWDRWRRILDVRDLSAADFVERVTERCPEVIRTQAEASFVTLVRDTDDEVRQERSLFVSEIPETLEGLHEIARVR